MTCREFIEFLWQYLGGALADEQRLRFEEHLAICPDCVHYLENYRETVRLTNETFQDPDRAVPADVPDDLIRAILDARSK